MKLTLSFLLALLATFAHAQKIRFTDTTNRWYICRNDPWRPDIFEKTIVQRLEYDTAVNGKEYFRYHMPGYNFGYNLVTEDTTAGKIYCLKTLDSPEVLMYDYNMQVGDTLTTYALWGGNFVLHSISSVNINNISHRVWNFNPGGRLIEGVGFTLGPYMFEPPHPDMWYYLCCFDNNGVRPVVTGNTSIIDNVNSCLVSVSDIAQLCSRTMVVPNPASSNAKLVPGSAVRYGMLTVYNSMGQVVAQQKLSGAKEIPLLGLIDISGVYFYSVRNNISGVVESGRFVWE